MISMNLRTRLPPKEAFATSSRTIDPVCPSDLPQIAATIIGDKLPEQVGSIIGAYKLLQ